MANNDQQKALCSLLDEAEPSADNSGDPTDSAAFAEEHLRRLRAEADALHKSSMLQVAQEQLAEYASEKSAAAAAILQQAESLEATLGQALQSGSSSSGAAAAAAAAAATQAVAAAMQQLKAQLAQAAMEAQAFAEQQQADVERAKRSSRQAELMDVDDQVEHKRARDGLGAADSSSSEEQEQQQASSSCSDDEDEDDEGVDGDPAFKAAQPIAGSSRAAAAAAAASAAGVNGSGSSGGGAASTVDPAAGPRAIARPGFRERCKYIPLRLKLEERRLLRLLEAALNVSEYTDKVDVLAWRSKTSRVHAQIKDFCAILSGLVVAQDYRRGQQLVADKDFDQNADFFQDVFEIGRRYKIMNPEKMRSEFGKLMYMLMDSADTHVQELLGFSCVRPLRTVASFLEEHGAAALLDDPLLELATAEIVAGDRPRAQVQREIKAKERAREALSRKYRNGQLSEEAILWSIYSISDNNSYLLFNRDPVDRMISHFTATFRPDAYEDGCSLAITGGRGGARLTHSHERQYHYVLQSLMLWREVSNDMFKLWYLAEHDMLRQGASYRLCDTGQGLNRVQSSPSLLRAMSNILARCQSAIGSWVGSSVIHLGDHNVPNSLFFLNKYTQVPQILNPVVLVIEELPKLCRDTQLAAYVAATYGSCEGAQKAILADFCRHAFDGSGADNFFDAGSCIDGRLTSAWNWCSNLHKKPYYPLFKLAGFVGFDGDFK